MHAATYEVELFEMHFFTLLISGMIKLRWLRNKNKNSAIWKRFFIQTVNLVTESLFIYSRHENKTTEQLSSLEPI